MTAGYKALREGAAVLDLDSRGRFRAVGEDRARLVHAMSTNHVQQLKPGESCYAFFLSDKGRVLADANILCFDEHLLLDVEPEAHDTLFQHLDKYIIADDVTLEDARQDTAVIAVEGPRAAEMLAAAGAPLPEPAHHAAWNGATVARLNVTGADGFRLFAPRPAMGSFRDLVSGAVPASEADILAVRLEHHKPRFGDDISEKYLPQETQQMHAVHFTKGCYLGQEIVERVRSRGQVHRLLTPLLIDGPAPAKGAVVKAGDKEAGEITSAAWSEDLGKTVALAYLRAEHAQPKTRLTVEAGEAEVLPR